MDREALAQVRIRAVSQIRSGESPEQVAIVLGINRTTIYRWMIRFAEDGYKGLKRKKAPGKEPILNHAQMKSLYSTLH